MDSSKSKYQFIVYKAIQPGTFSSPLVPHNTLARSVDWRQ